MSDHINEAVNRLVDISKIYFIQGVWLAQLHADGGLDFHL